MASDHDRLALYEALQQRLGAGPATTLMTMLPPMPWEELATKMDLRELRAEMHEGFAEIKQEFAIFDRRLTALEGRVNNLFPKLVAANIASMMGVAGLVLAAAKLA